MEKVCHLPFFRYLIRKTRVIGLLDDVMEVDKKGTFINVRYRFSILVSNILKQEKGVF